MRDSRPKHVRLRIRPRSPCFPLPYRTRPCDDSDDIPKNATMTGNSFAVARGRLDAESMERSSLVTIHPKRGRRFRGIIERSRGKGNRRNRRTV